MLIFDDSRGEICNSKEFVDLDTAGRHRGLSNIYIRHKLFRQNELGCDVQFQKTHLVLFEFPREVMQVSKISAQMARRSELIGWCRDALPVPYGDLLIEKSPRTDNRLRNFTKTGSITPVF